MFRAILLLAIRLDTIIGENYTLYNMIQLVYRVLVGKPEEKNHWGDLGVDGWIILG